MLCPIHQVEFKLVPAGVSKSTGKPYQAFYACPERGCRERPPKANEPAKSVPAKKDTDWGQIGKQKALCGMVNAMLSAGLSPDEVSKNLLALNGIFSKIETLSGVPATQPVQPVQQKPLPAPSDDFEAGNRAIAEAQAEEGVDVDGIDF